MKNNEKQAGDAVSPVYQCALPLSTNTINYIADLLRAHLKAIGSRWRSKTAGQIAVLVLAVLRHDQRAADLAGGNAVSATTIRRWTDEVVALLAAKAPRLDRALKKITRAGGEVALLDGTLIRTRRRSGKANRKNCRVGTERGSGVATGPFLRAARRTRRAALTAPGSPRFLPSGVVEGPGVGDRVAAVSVAGYRDRDHRE